MTLRRAARAGSWTVVLLGVACTGDDADGRLAAEGPPAGVSQEAWGEHLFTTHGCLGCHNLHRVPGVGGPLNGLWGQVRRFQDGGETVVDTQYVRESILHPGARVVEGFDPVMPSYRELLSDAQCDALVDYLQSLP